MDKIFSTLNEMRSSLQENIVDAVGINRELRIFKKTVFIIEKKIENIYNIISKQKKEDSQ
jgi:hypothetical protein